MCTAGACELESLERVSMSDRAGLRLCVEYSMVYPGIGSGGWGEQRCGTVPPHQQSLVPGWSSDWRRNKDNPLA